MDPSSSAIDDRSENEHEKVNVNGEVAIDGGEDVETSPKMASSVKGKGLRKWRRFKRETISTEATSSADGDRNLKRGLSSELQSSSKPKSQDFPATPPAVEGEEERSSVASATPSAAVADSGGCGDEDDLTKLELPSLDPGLGVLVTETGFSMGCFDSDNSEDWSSKSSTAPSWPSWQRAELGKQKCRGRGWGGERYGGLFHQQQPLRAATRAGRSRGRVGGVESDVRSSDVAVVQVGSASSNGGGSVNYEGGGMGEDSGCEFYKGNGEEDIDGRNREEEGEDDEREECVSFMPKDDEDTLLEPLGVLQEALERELQKYQDFENELQSKEDEAVNSPSPSPSPDPSGLVGPEMAKPKEEKDIGHGSTTGIPTSPAKDSEGTLPLQYQDKLDEENAQLENTLKDKLKLEIECMIMSQTIQHWKVAMEDQLALSEEQKSILADGEKFASRPSDADNSRTPELEARPSDADDSRTGELEAQAMEPRGLQQNLAGKDETLTIQKGALCLLLELIMLCLAFWFILSLVMPPPPSDDFVPT